jgi:KaiC/GvpD/RAD55 family RecA-like ATPase
MWYAREGGEIKYDVSDLASLSYNIKDVLRKNAGRRMRIATDVLSSLLVLNQVETVYRFLSQLFSDIKQYDVVLVATLEEGMHDTKVVSTIAESFDGVLEFKLYEDGFRLTPLMRISKMRGTSSPPGYFSFALSGKGMEISAYAR